MASECSWTDAVVALQVWCQLADFCHHAKDHSLVLRCTKSALQLEEAAVKGLRAMPSALYSLTAVDEMLSGASCLRGLSLVHESSGDLHAYREALMVFLSGVSYAEKADNPALCVAAAKHYWNTCLPLTHTPEERRQLQEPLEKILMALVHTDRKQPHKQGSMEGLLTSSAPPVGTRRHEAADEGDLTLRAAIYDLLLHIHADQTDWKSALKLLEKAIVDMPPSKHPPLRKQLILVKTRLGENVLMDMLMLQDGELCCSDMWHQMALCTGDITQQFDCYQKSIACLLSVEHQRQKVSLLLEFGEWQYCHNFPKAGVLQQLHRAVDVLHLETGQTEAAELSSVKWEAPLGVHGLFLTETNVREVWRLDGLVRAHTLLAVMAGKASPEHQLHLLRAYVFVLRMWQVSLAVVSCEISSEVANSQAPPPPPPSAGSKKGKGKGKKVKDPPPPEERLKPVVLDQVLPSTPEDWARYVCPDQTRHFFRTSSNPHCINTHSITEQTQSLFYLDLLEKELHSLSLDHLTLPIMHLSETIAHDLLDRRSLSDVYRLRIVRTCCQLGLETHSPYQEELVNLSRVREQEQLSARKTIFSSQASQERSGLQIVKVANSGRRSRDVSSQDIWLDKAEVCLSIGLWQAARELLVEAHHVAAELGDHKATARSLLSLAILACDEQDYSMAWILLDKAQDLGGDEDFWYQLTLTKVRAAVGQKHQAAHTKTEQIIKQGCSALKQVLEQRVNPVPDITFLITSLEMRGAVECLRARGGGEAGEALDHEVVQRLMAACSTLRECAAGFTKLGYGERAVEARVENAQGLRILASRSTHTEDKRRFLLDAVSQMQLAVTEQEHAALNAQRLPPSHEEANEGPGLSLVAERRLLRLRLALAECCLVVLEEQRAEEKRQAVARQRKTSTQIAVEEFTCEPNSTEQEWVSVGSTLGPVALSQLDTVRSHPLDDVETKARCLGLQGKYLRLLAVQEDPGYVHALWDGPKQKEAWSDPKAVSVEEENSERVTSAKSAELQRRAQQLLAEAVGLCLQHKLPSSVLADASINMVECHGQSDPAAAGQHLALFQSCCTVAPLAEVLSSACADTSRSQLSALLSLRRKLLLSREERPSSVLKRAEDFLNSLSKVFSHLTVHPNHLNILADFPSNLKILLLQHSEDGSELYGAFYETTKAPNQKGKTAHVTGNLTCSRVAKASVCPQALLALREQTRAFGQETRHLKRACWHAAEGGPEASEERRVLPLKTAAEGMLETDFREIVREMEDYLNPLLKQFDFWCLRPEAAPPPGPEMTRTKEKEERGSSVKLPAEPEEHVVLLADRKLLALPLEALSILQDEGLTSVSRDFSLQLLHSRLTREEPAKVESDNKKETKGGKTTKGKADQSQAIKVTSATRVAPPNTFPVDIRNMNYVVDLGGFGPSLRMTEILQSHSRRVSRLWEASVGSSVGIREKPSVFDMEQLLCRCSALAYLGMERFTASTPPAKLVALNLSGCRLALLFDLVHNTASAVRQSNPDVHDSPAGPDLEEALETALLLSLGGLGCVVVNQWQSSLQENTDNMEDVLDSLLRVRQTSGQTIQALRRRDRSPTPHQVPGSDDRLLLYSEEDKTTLTPSAFTCVLYGLPNLIVK